MNFDARTKAAFGGIGALLLLLIVWAVQAWVFTPQAAMATRIEAARNTLERRRADLLGRDRLLEKVAQHVERTLGGSQEEVDHALRAALSTLGEAAGLSDVAVDTSAVKEVTSPGRRDFKGARGKPLRDEIDFVEVPATLRATGTWPEFNQLLQGIAAQPWTRQIEGLRVVGRGRGDTMEVTMKIRTLFIPGEAPESSLPPLAVSWPDSLGNRNPFTLPPPPAPPTPAHVATQSPSGPGWDRWRVTFVGRIEGVDEVHLRGTDRHRRRLASGESIEGCQYLGNRLDPDGFDEAVFRRDGKTWIVPPGATFADRRPVAE